MMYLILGRDIQAVVLRMDHKGTKEAAGSPGRSYNNSPGRTDGSLDQGGGRGGGDK